MITHHDQEFADLKQLLLTMAAHSRDAVTRAIQALTDRNEELAKRVIEDDSIVDQLEIKVDEVEPAFESSSRGRSSPHHYCDEGIARSRAGM
ncbi:MAG TPA: PhoU domain-containing protein [Candidatus Acidoferrum sp.]|nr:PhoU domain-containing protein [Candidatus Acidoferrum sp.]